MICVLLVLKSLMRNRFATKSREGDLFRFNTSKPYNRIGMHLHYTGCSTTSSEAIRPTLPKILFAALCLLTYMLNGYSHASAYPKPKRKGRLFV